MAEDINEEPGAESPLLNKHMNEAFDWSDSKLPVRDALWDYYMEKNDHDTMKTGQDMEKYMDMSTDDLKADAEKLLKK
ncbi:MAG: hypothetical protein ABF679_08580 [Lentilactobacillus diolivorans]|uniref:Uncharacterized protein n=2 Tax=Lentilactobacillus diolivorans TaxID=179838 RepID=A0A0R1S7C2_9LACO|nr:hypothetical protein [Lentilactobacillus diolivorans]RRG02535.1 MAG: hypothetical protein DUD34_08590 [Lactobacillus sp.]KRL62389.1 hypothetical protein FC85_GL001893 [Lentilactobacillus diolivorans DSM 14421]MCH4163900.1 hypothetical protein [Lentilactobacillus diolivorans]MDH5106921.1 hypothetical protein [Lentilactobacillus diolivorans]GEP25157.1 hypothetical protein LDI01_27500 [Lentilactobacillus diolivorans]